jgi:hypothetical protein
VGVQQGRQDTFTRADKANSSSAALVRKVNSSIQILTKR